MQRLVIAVVLAASLAPAGCTGVRLLPAPPGPRADLARIAGMPEGAEIRFWGDMPRENAEARLSLVRRQIAARIRAQGAPPDDGRYDVLALSGGGPDGAYGAGLLNGWSDRAVGAPGAVRPEFSLVTGISVGALIAPFAFLGPDYDDELERLFTTTSTAELVDLALFDAAFGYTLGLTNVRPLAETLAEIVTPAFVRRIAEEHLKGRRLWIGTTWLDTERPVIWDIGAIAVSDYRRKAELIRKILLASSAIPGAFPPVEFAVEIGGEYYSEMHVDGSVTRQLFVYPSNITLGDKVGEQVPALEPGTIYVVRNSKLAPDYDPVAPSLLSILERSLFTLTNALAISDVESIESQAEAEGWRLLISAVPPEFEFSSEDFFDPRYMRALYEVGYARALEHDAWTVLNDPAAPGPDALAEAG